MAFEAISENLSRLKADVEELLNTNVEYYKLKLFFITMKGATVAVKTVAVAFFIVVSLLFLSVGLALSLSDVLDHPASGFFIVGGFYLIVGFYVIFFGSRIINKTLLLMGSKKFYGAKQKDENNVNEGDNEII